MFLTAPNWYVSADGKTVGPVSADQIARGIRAGLVPRDAQVAFVGDGNWKDILDVPEVIEALKVSKAG
jgi:hypothetical protein